MKLQLQDEYFDRKSKASTDNNIFFDIIEIDDIFRICYSHEDVTVKNDVVFDSIVDQLQ